MEEDEDRLFISYFGEPEEEYDEDGQVIPTKNRRNRVGPPAKKGWEKAEIFVELLRVLYDVTLRPLYLSPRLLAVDTAIRPCRYNPSGPVNSSPSPIGLVPAQSASISASLSAAALNQPPSDHHDARTDLSLRSLPRLLLCPAITVAATPSACTQPEGLFSLSAPPCFASRPTHCDLFPVLKLCPAPHSPATFSY
ncbi:hypothetical protein M0R45_016123 [Rubus argutus]|uniref:Uncharacterized protein n=1 Tax=Rubus argutus TaxID=59490 RepID=A0AAW1XS62_RUBAR